jgi:hypothetical protein
MIMIVKITLPIGDIIPPYYQKQIIMVLAPFVNTLQRKNPGIVFLSRQYTCREAEKKDN